jgi:hypothetical protein
MDRLNEANKVASLMRRRENLKPITALQPVIASVLASRGFPAAKGASTRSIVTSFKPVPAALRTSRAMHASTEWVLSKTRGVAGASVTRLLERRVALLRSRALVVPPPRRRVDSQLTVPQARIAMPRNRIAPREAVQRMFDMQPLDKRKAALGHSAPRRAAELVRIFDQACRVRPIATTAVSGKDLRVSQSQGFRPPQLRRGPMATAPRKQSALTWNDGPRNLELVYEFPAPEPSPATLAPAVREPRYPAARNPMGGSSAMWLAARAPKRASKQAEPCDAVPAVVRVSEVSWNTSPPEASLRCEWYKASPAIILGYSKEPHRGSAGDPKIPVPADIRVEENFASGCSNWAGGVADWRLDAAGARTGSLALFVPSLELVDYDLEFLARVESRSVTWVFRAADMREYYRASLRVAPDGGYEFTRTAVIAEAAEPAVSSLVTVNSNARTALAVRTSVRGSEFAVYIEGQAVDRWNDDRLTLGGVGFGSAPDDRARLYWIRLTYAGSPGLKDVMR